MAEQRIDVTRSTIIRFSVFQNKGLLIDTLLVYRATANKRTYTA